jgi:hypothetical protein
MDIPPQVSHFFQSTVNHFINLIPALGLPSEKKQETGSMWNSSELT